MQPEITINPKRLELDETYLQMAEIWAKRSKANRMQVGALLVKNNQIISDGYNGMPVGWDNDVCEYWDESIDPPTMLTKPELLHAESNVLSKISKNGGIGAEGATLYVTLSPCKECAKLIGQNKVARVVYRTPYRLTDGLDILSKFKIPHLQLISPYSEQND